LPRRGRIEVKLSHALTTKAILWVSVTTTVLAAGKVHASVLGHYDLTDSSRFIWIIIYGFLCFVLSYSFGLPDQSTWSTRTVASLAATVSSALTISLFQIVIGNIIIPRFVIAISVPTLFLVLLLVSYIATKLNRNATDRERILLITSDSDAEIIRKDIAFHAEIPCVIVHQLTPDRLHDIKGIILDKSITLVVVDNLSDADSDIVKSITDLHSRGVRIRSQLSFYNDWIGKIPIRKLGETALLFDVREIHHLGYSRVSRMLDIGIALTGIVVLVFVTPFVMIGNSLASRGPLLYSQERIGKGQIPFRIYKFRSMRTGDLSGDWTRENDGRITNFGKLLRRSHLDELPQIINILRGDLSIVGPRPEQGHYVEQLSKKIPFYESRHLVRPGLTGWAQVNYPYGADEIDAYEKLQYEFWYLQHQSLWLDLRIIVRTFRHILGFKGR
jgi:lipopolysaccharide/colanic/teichoic acid biosynthesis glycosyltransferase